MGLLDRFTGALSKPFGKKDRQDEIKQTNIQNALDHLKSRKDSLQANLARLGYSEKDIGSILSGVESRMRTEAESSQTIISTEDWYDKVDLFIESEKNRISFEKVDAEKTTEELLAEVNKNISESTEQIQESNQTLQNDYQYANAIIQEGNKTLFDNIGRSQETIDRALGSNGSKGRAVDPFESLSKPPLEYDIDAPQKSQDTSNRTTGSNQQPNTLPSMSDYSKLDEDERVALYKSLSREQKNQLDFKVSKDRRYYKKN